LFCTVKGYSGVGWDREQNTVTADPTVWERIFRAFPRAKKFQKRGLEMFDELDELFSGSRATGRFVRTSLNGDGDEEAGKSQNEDLFQLEDPPVDPELENAVQSEAVAPSSPSPRPAENGEQSTAPTAVNSDTAITPASRPSARDTATTPASKPSARDTATTPASARNAFKTPTTRKTPRGNSEEPGAMESGTEISGSGNKRVKRERPTVGGQIVKSLSDLRETAVKLQWQGSKVERAVTKLEKAYPDLTEEELTDAYNIFKKLRKAEMFISMSPGGARDRWIKKEMAKQRRRAEREVESTDED
jgi:hypothetical protein